MKFKLGRLRRQFKAFQLRGDKYYCPFCERHYARFLDNGEKAEVLEKYEVVGGGFRPEIICPLDGSSDRERLLYLFLSQELKLFDNTHFEQKILHFSPEPNLGPRLRDSFKDGYICGDINPAVADHQVDITAIQFADNSFEHIICSHVLEHIPNDTQAMRELYRVMKPGGWGIFQVPLSSTLEKTKEEPDISDPDEMFRRFGQRDHVRIYAVQGYVDRLEAAGFDVEVVDWTQRDWAGKAAAWALNPKERIIFCQKK